MRLFKFIGYTCLFVVSFVFFLYLTFPYDVLKHRLIGIAEVTLGSNIEISVQSLSPYFFTGVRLKGVELNRRGGEKLVPLLVCDELRARVSLLSLLIGRTRLGFSLTAGRGRVSGHASRDEDAMDVSLNLDRVDIGSFKVLDSRFGLPFKSRIDGDAKLSLDRRRPVRSTGKIEFDVPEFTLAATSLTLAGSVVTLPAMTFSHGKESGFKATIDKGAISIDQLRLVGGDVSLDLKGKVFLSNDVANMRLNLSGTFATSDQLVQALPFLFIIEKQKGPDGHYPVSITGRLAEPSIKIGTFTLPM